MTESRLQQMCVNWFRAQYPKHRVFLIAIPNGGRRDPRTGALMKKEGAVAGASDLILFCPSGMTLPIMLECKTGTGKQSPNQKLFEAAYKSAGYRYEVFRSLDEFMAIVNPFMAVT
jgi:hypothetical protein